MKKENFTYGLMKGALLTQGNPIIFVSRLYSTASWNEGDTNTKKGNYYITMNTLTLIICLLPIVFMFHDFEEIIFFKPWINKNSAYLRERFPRLSKKFLPRFESLSTSGFALAVAEEFVLLSFITYGSIYFDNYYLWIAAFMAFFIHLIMHVAQWIILRRYIPMIVTSLISLPYCVYALIEILGNNMFQISEIVLWTLSV